MKKYKEIGILLILVVVDLINGNIFYNVVNRQSPCNTVCEESSYFGNNINIKSCCQRGCRFFNLVDRRGGLEPDNLNATEYTCEAACDEAYDRIIQDRIACRMGCGFMAKRRISDLISLVSIAMYVEEGVNSGILLMSPDIPENDILTDPGLRKELFPGWWDSNGFKLPQTYIKTVPIDSGTSDYGIPSDYSGENEQSVSMPGSDWLQCASRHTGIPRWLLASSIAVAALSALWLCLSPDKSIELGEGILEKSSVPNKMTMYIPGEEPLHKKPPPKYSEEDDLINVNVKV
ncbi:transmembrane protein 59-like isoform X2 [Orussus abietinus]|uniref:transmembrane protein 59-like isoform X2 n=1 Tax=Orussus abietinus TaxID=222816 RepID=UPI000626E8E6|nr:transmembrane protein 59-like isoform X2 [Orussus abietinus]